MLFKGVIFDLDGTLADTLDDIGESVNKVLKLHGFPERPVSNYKFLVGKGLDNLIKQALPVEAQLPDIIEICLEEMVKDYNQNCLVKTKLYDGIKNLLTKISASNIKMAVFSNKAEPLTIKIVNLLLPDFSFTNIMGARKDRPKKPDPSGALVIAQNMGFHPSEVIYLGDTDVDMQTANNAGMFAIGVSWGFRSIKELKENGARIILNHPQELSEYIELH